MTDSTAKEQTIVKLGNSAPLVQERQQTSVDPDGNPVFGNVGVLAKHMQQSVTTVEMWPGFDAAETVENATSTDNDRILSMIHRALPDQFKKFAVGIHELEQIFSVHSAHSKPAWVTSNDPEFAEAIGHHFGIPVGESTMLLTTAGRDALHAQHMSTSAQPASFNYMGLANSGTATTPLVGDTTLTGEITTAGGGLIRAQATYAHTGGTNTTTLTKTFTANGSDSLAVTISQMAIFNASTAGTMAYKTALSSSATLNVSGDSLTITETVTGG